MIATLTLRDWVIFKSRGDPDQPFWLGMTISHPDWGSQCILKNDSNGTTNIGNSLITQGGYAINVQWYTQKVFWLPEYIVEGGDRAKPVV